MSEESLRIPERCKGCPCIFPTLKAYLAKEGELYILQNDAQLSEYADPGDIDARVRQLRREVIDIEEELIGLKALTVGCAGVKLSQVKIGDEFITSADCQSPLMNRPM
jgi:hypothetical protein